MGKKLADEEYWLTAREFAQLTRQSARHVRRRYAAPQYAGQVRQDAQGGYWLHAHLLPSRALRDFYLAHGRPVPEYLKRELSGTPLDTIPDA
jgi:hypothetical protein